MVENDDNCRCKVGRTSTEYELQGIDAWLPEEWQNGESVRELTEELNKEVIQSALTTASSSPLEWGLSPVYEALQTDELSDADEIEIRRELERSDIDVEELESNLVSHQTVYRHLTRCLDASKDAKKSPEERRNTARQTVFALQQRTELVTESTLETLHSADVTTLSNFEVLVDLQIVCNDCGRSLDFETAIKEGCDCDSV